jgi:myo-inositol-1(or 4)-monophosphatase
MWRIAPRQIIVGGAGGGVSGIEGSEDPFTTGQAIYGNEFVPAEPVKFSPLGK